jgi:hypothetical protein
MLTPEGLDTRLLNGNLLLTSDVLKSLYVSSRSPQVSISSDVGSSKRGFSMEAQTVRLIQSQGNSRLNFSVHGAFDLSGEPMASQITATYGTRKNQFTASEICAVNVAKRQYQKEVGLA